MKNWKSIIFILVFFALPGCQANVSPTPTITTMQENSTLIISTPIPTKTPVPQFSVSKKTSLEIHRNGEMYEVFIGYSNGRAPFRATQQVGEKPKVWSEPYAYADGATIEAYSDFDNDGEIEILVSVFSCGAGCITRLIVYEYDPVNDMFFASDEIWASLREYADFDNDGTPEFTLYENGFCFRCSNASDALSALIVLRYKNRHFVDVTIEFPELIQQNADSFLQKAKINNQNAASIFLSGYLYNMYRLGKMDEGKLVFDDVCASVLQSESFDCESFRMAVEESILSYKFRH